MVRSVRPFRAQKHAAIAALLAFGVFAASDARAQDNTVAAQSLYDEAVAAMDKKDFATACPKLDEVTKLIPEGVGARLTLAECYAGQDKLASAWGSYVIAEAAAAKAGQAERRKKAHDLGAALKPKLATLALVVADAVRATPGLVIERDGVAVGAAQWGSAIPVDKGSHVVTAKAPGKAKWEQTVVVAKDGTSVKLAIDALSEPVATPVSSASATSSAAPATAPDDVAPPSKPGNTLRTAALVVGGVGVIGVALGVVFGVTALGKKSDSNNGHCDDSDQCDATGLSLRSSGRTAGTVSTIAFIAGGAALAGGVALFAIAPKSSDATVGVTPGGMAIRGSF